MTEIAFRETAKAAALSWRERPRPSVESLPKWFKQTPTVVPNASPQEFPMGTVRRCMPFFDAMTAGYMLLLPEALHVHYPEDSSVVHFTWRRTEMGLRIETHGEEQLPDALTPSNGVYKFVQPWGLEIPETHSALYMHPLNRNDLPFRAFAGVVDGSYKSPVNIPFVWTGAPGETVTLDAGTPIAQIVPFLREEWEQVTREVPPDLHDADAFAASTHVEGYRKLFRRVKTWR